jgi:hypothetical protein
MVKSSIVTPVHVPKIYAMNGSHPQNWGGYHWKRQWKIMSLDDMKQRAAGYFVLSAKKKKKKNRKQILINMQRIC